MRVVWRRGFLRLWIFLSIIWIGCALYVERPDVELRRNRSAIVIQYGNTSIQFPSDSDTGEIARAIDDWLKAENALSKKLRDKLPLTDDEQKRFAERLHGREQLNPWETDDLVLVGDELAKKAAADRPEPFWGFIARYVGFTAGPPLLLLAFGILVGWVMRGFLPKPRGA